MDGTIPGNPRLQFQKRIEGLRDRSQLHQPLRNHPRPLQTEEAGALFIWVKRQPNEDSRLRRSLANKRIESANEPQFGILASHRLPTNPRTDSLSFPEA